MHLRRELIAIMAFTALAVPIVTAGAQDAKPVPCTGILISDGKDDQTKAPVGGGSAGLPHGSTGPDNIDIRGLFFNFAPGADGTPVLTANIQIENLTAEVPAEARSGEVRYLVDFDTLGDVAYLTARLTSSGFSFVAGVFTDLPDPLGGAQLTEVEIKGKAFEGKDGVLQIEMPASAGVKDGTQMTGVITRVSLGDNEVIFVSDQAPDGGVADAVDFTVRSCPPPPPGAGGQTQPGQTQPGQTQPGQTQPGQTQPGQTQPGQSSPGQSRPTPGQPGAGLLPVAGPLTVSVAIDKGKRKTARKRGLRVRVRCSVQCKATAVATIDKKTARKLGLGKKAVRIGAGKATIIRPGRIPFFVKLTGKAKKALGRKGVKKFSLKVAFTVTDLNGKQLKKATKKSTLR